eukprot:TRINITY_DN9243_c0_g1_i1.p1 TRINITY_DN9243_c0_g1~~TRINITY_DN9243_c0_g1_i1.p1  ORF type:complete len:351 (+),score=55.24 TRINITY_DN9243_c0_g1_i1:65-1054(+)
MAVDSMAILALVSVFLYQLNGHILKAIGKLKAIDPVTQVWLLHVVIVVMAPYAYTRRNALFEEMKKLKMSMKSFLVSVVVNTFLQMGINLFWLHSAKAIPVQLTSAIYQTAIGLVYVCSVLVLGEPLAFWKASGVVLAIGGVVLSSYFHPLPPGAVTSASTDDAEYRFGFGVACASSALMCKVASQIWCRVTLVGASSEFMVHYNIHVGLAHIYAFLPFMLMANSAGFSGMSFRIDTRWPVIPAMLVASLICSGVSYGYQTVPVVKSPLYLCRFQTLGVVIAVALDYSLYGTVPQTLGYVGYVLILGSFALVSGIIDPSKWMGSSKKRD